VSAMVRPHVVNFLDEMLRSEDNLRMEEVVVSAGFSGKMLSMLISASRDYVVLAIRQGREWVFNPSLQHVVHDGDVLMVMTTPHGRTRMEQLIQGVA